MKKEHKSEAEKIRQKAEEQFKKRPAKANPDLSEASTSRLIHELEVHQIELEMQSEELITAKEKAELSEEKFTQLYDFAPFGYLTLTKEGEINQLNFSAANLLEKDRSQLIKRRFLPFMAENIRPVFIQFLENVFQTKLKQSCELMLLTQSNTPKYVLLEGKISEGNEECLITLIDITERKQAEEKLAIHNSILSGIIEGTQDLIFSLNKNYCYTSFNKNHAAVMKAIYGVDIEIGQNILDYMLVEEDRQIAKNNIDRTLAGESLINEAFSGDALHSRLYFEVKHNPIINTDGKIIGVAIKSEEITKRKQAEDKLKKSKSELEEYFENDISANYVVSIEGEIFSCNSTFLNMFGFKEKAHTKKIDITELYKKPDDRQELIRRIKTKGRVENYEVEFITRKGKTINAILNAIGIFNDSGELVQTRGYIVDITDRKKAEEELLKAKAKAEESDNLKTAFLANMSHEIRTPMNAILGFSQLLLSDTLKADEKKIFANYIQTNGENLVKIIDDIIDISKIQLKQLQVKMTDFDLHLMIKELEIYYTKILEQNSKNLIELKTEIPNKINDVFFIHSDALRLKQILNNLISNATKYTKKGQIVFGYKLVENEIHFFVKDTGVGIEAKNQTIIFDRFIQFSDEYIAREKGTGLGLPISKDLVALLAGELKVKSKKGKGSIFYFALPYVEIHPKIQNKNITRKKITDYNLSGNRILIVDDEESNFVLTKRILHDTKVKMDWANNGTKAVKMAENKKYSLIIMDIKMPIMDGIEATRRIKAHDKNIPIIIQTAFALDETKQQCIQAGCNDFVQKPISIEDFLTLVTKFILKNEELD